MRSTTKWKCIGLALIGTLAASTPATFADIPGTRPAAYPVSLVSSQESNSLDPVVTEIGRISVSVDGAGTVADSGVVQVEKPAGATVRRAFLTAVSAGFSGYQIGDGAITVDGAGVNWDTEVPTAFDSYNYFTEITALVAPKLNSASTGRVDFVIHEASPIDIDGVALVVIFDDPAQTSDVTVVLFFGAQSAEGNRFSVGLAEAIDTSDPDLWIDFCLGISYSFQSPDVTDQFSQVNVNGKRLTSSAGGQDDGTEANGSLFTIGGLDDSSANPDSLAPPANYDTDDERYTLVPYVEDGDTRITIETINPSFDDNVFFACLTTSVAAGVGEALILAPSSSSGGVGGHHTVVATFQDALGERIASAEVDFEVFSGPHSGEMATVTTDANGQANFSYSGTTLGTDSISAQATGTEGEVASNVVSREWTDQPLDNYALTLDPPNSSGAVGFSHTLSARLTNNGATEAGRSIEFDVFAGPHTGVNFATTTGSDGIAEFQYFGTTVGIDSIVARATIPGIPPLTVTSNIAQREWRSDNGGGTNVYKLTLAPDSSSGTVGSLHTLSATLTNTDNPQPGRQVAFEVFSGPHAGMTGTITTDGSGVAVFQYTGTSTGTDSIVASATIANDTTVTSNIAKREWTEDTRPDDYLLTLDPTNSKGDINFTHMLSARLTNRGTPRAGRRIAFEVFAGPHAGESLSATTDTDGIAEFQYFGTTVGIDSVVASTVIQGTPPMTITSNVAVREWTDTDVGTDVYKLTLAPQRSTGTVGSRHTLTAILTKTDNPQPGHHITFEVFVGPNIGMTGTSTTRPDGSAEFQYTSARAGIDSIIARAIVADIPPMTIASGTVAREWTDRVGPDTYLLILAPTHSSDEVDLQHTVTATFTVNGMPKGAQSVDFAVFAGPHAGATGSGVTDAIGNATFAYTGRRAGLDSIIATIELASRDRRGPPNKGAADVTSNVATTLWTDDETPPGTVVTLAPESANNLLGVQHTVTTTVRTDGLPRSGTRVEFAVSAGPHAGMSGADTTDSTGRARFRYVGTVLGLDTLRALAIIDGVPLPSNTVTATWTDDDDPGSGGIAVDMDIKPGSCISPINTTSKGVTPVALLGSDGVDVYNIDVSSLRLEGAPPLRHNYVDSGTPAPDVDCGCSARGADGHADINLKFDTQAFVAGLGPVTDREVRTVTLTGKFKDGRALVATDCILIIDHETHTGGGGGGDDGDEDVGEGTFGLEPATPNPFNPVTAISYQVADAGIVRLVVFDVRGRRVATLVDEFRDAGEHTANWTASGLASGVYFYRLKSGGQSMVRRAILLK